MIIIRKGADKIQFTFMAQINRMLCDVKTFFTSAYFNKVKRASMGLLWASGVLVFLAFLIYLFSWFVPSASELAVTTVPAMSSGMVEASDPEYNRVIAVAHKELEVLERKYNTLTPKQKYLVINTSENHFYLYHDKKIVREGFVSTGSNIRMLTNDNREWVFKTPKGKHTVKNKITSPVWKKPDWAFIEDGLPVPPENHDSRFEYGSLGDYALNLGGGYLIHGTLYKRLLGMPVTHGCIRLNDEDLEYIYKTLNPGSKVYIF